jgi:hypothetical protein
MHIRISSIVISAVKTQVMSSLIEWRFMMYKANQQCTDATIAVAEEEVRRVGLGSHGLD